ncbi:NADH:flavin oxidoreductase/NADH oxidase family protein [Aspergillus fijiensis CBS 313.89]|uniref:Putative FMN binding oxidoreductase n=1 Tax=Aspergillus fijiensis CBS 313.89 TaxID=1448319 RepID=A0A8G1RX51_9EURO|nr:putative FMN binding oxidoreductase [Aspergillus fijiensis CBS 313.89]RAK81637.1 putative FMN binding oxidoreductase [Aspergillus fijiensis CBS 313.89]
MPSVLSEPVKLPCGLVLPNRLAKAALAESLAGSQNTITPTLLKAYERWGQGGWGAILTGNVQVDINHMGQPFDLALQGEYTDKADPAMQPLLASWASYAAAIQQHHGTPAIVQLCHPGRQSARFAGRRGMFAPTLAPSPIPLQMGGDGFLARWISRFLFPAPREMDQTDIDRVVRQFVDAARVMADSGFSGVELHGAHGYLIDQFLNAKTNKRTDAYGGSAEKRAKFVLDIIRAVREVVPREFAVGIKLNSADHSSSTFEETMMQIQLLVEAGVDFMEISGGSYENPEMMGLDAAAVAPKSERTLVREAFFLDFARETRQRFPDLVLMLTGGFRTRAGAEAAVQQNVCDIIGLGRPAAIDPDLPRLFLDDGLEEEKARLVLGRVPVPALVRLLPFKGVGAGLESNYYAAQIKRFAMGLRTIIPGV